MNDTKILNGIISKELKQLNKAIAALGTREGAISLFNAILPFLKGDQGDKPLKGVDYFTDDDIDAFVTMCSLLARPVRGEDYFTEEDKTKMADAIRQDIQKKIRAPKRGRDFMTAEDQKEIDRMVRSIIGKTMGKRNTITITRDNAKQVIDKLLQSPYAIARALETLKGIDRLDWSALKNAPRPTVQYFYGGAQDSGGGSTPTTINFADEENLDPTNTADGVKVAFPLLHIPVAGSVKITLNGARQQLGSDYTLPANVPTFANAPLAGSIILADYRF